MPNIDDRRTVLAVRFEVKGERGRLGIGSESAYLARTRTQVYCA